ncbi:ribose 5-phosphate isomerase B [Flavilitoribacter nigricans]|uniref:Ribose 5-phosphate isomerase B n=1 Tax=Flavilitoribacter nigricans (strain ATCC 23147 / DSM 23189 / NBRC 102662 / NCIMB 1420 / SS-2) TaxID=1122177 RepID=A0A2D0NAN8_FLAN2|nr:ribose 5-phosphate isomerase B [Flavilitoribacter nigricans]PHN05448.1 ribose 5-phosphate isomerase B [Flavilitoribacter nigricans DSM 23189 = NBRC 102662]
MPNVNNIAIGCDHAGFPYKAAIIAHLEQKGISVQDFGAPSADSVDYPDFAHPVAKAVETEQVDLGILLCGSGNGVAITANKHQSVRAALCWLPEIAALARQHNNANALALPVRFVSEETALQIVDAFLDSTFEGGRHARRVGKISC